MLFAGEFLAGPILLALATEIALKAWQCRERQGAPEHGHDLLKLFERLSPDARNSLEAAWLERPPPPAVDLFVPKILRMRRVLAIHHDTFVRWRYAHEPEDADESGDADIVPPALDAALTVILEVYDRTPA